MHPVGPRLINHHPHDMHAFWFAFSTLLLVCVSAQGLTSGQIDTVQQLLALGATERSVIPQPRPLLCSSDVLYHSPHCSWELGTRAQALLELSTPSFSVLTPNVSLPPPTSLNSSLNNSLADVFTIAQNAVAALAPPPSDGTGQPLADGDGSAGDPASIGVAVLIANWTNLGGEDYAGAATAQLEYLLGPSVPKTTDGAISHRVSDLQLWCACFLFFLPDVAVLIRNASIGQTRCTWYPPSLRTMV